LSLLQKVFDFRDLDILDVVNGIKDWDIAGGLGYFYVD
jgi:hypothetical protein